MMALALGTDLSGTSLRGRWKQTGNAAYLYIIKNSRGQFSWLLEKFILNPNLHYVIQSNEWKITASKARIRSSLGILPAVAAYNPIGKSVFTSSVTKSYMYLKKLLTV